MELEEIKKRLEAENIEVIPGRVYDIFECCVQRHDEVKSEPKTTRGKTSIVCSIHHKKFSTKYRLCPTCGNELTGKKIQNGKMCPECRTNNPPKDDGCFKEHARGRYCYHYKLDKTGCHLAPDCWYCDDFDPIFPKTGPPRRYKNGK